MIEATFTDRVIDTDRVTVRPGMPAAEGEPERVIIEGWSAGWHNETVDVGGATLERDQCIALIFAIMEAGKIGLDDIGFAAVTA